MGGQGWYMQAKAPDWPGLVNKNLGPGPLNANWGPGPGAGAGDQAKVRGLENANTPQK